MASTTARLFSRVLACHLQGQGSKFTPLIIRNNYSFKSSISLDKLYPQSSLSICKVPPPPQNEPTKFSGYIPMDKLTLSYSRSSGPGGQNVNKLNTKVNLKFKVDEADWIPDIVLKNFKERFKTHINKEGFLTVHSDRTRYQHLNTADAIQKLREMIRACEPDDVLPPSPEDMEKHRRLREKAARERLLQKRTRSHTKGSRGAV